MGLLAQRVIARLKRGVGVLGRPVQRYFLPDEIRATGLREALGYLSSYRVPRPSGEGRCDSPIFILSAGWRTGSTLIQRLVVSDASTLVWGEPYGDWVPVPRMAQMLATFDPKSRHIDYSIEKYSGDLTKQFIANMNPGIAPMLAAHREFLDALYGRTALARGYRRWGAKFVRLTAHHALYLKLLYPGAKFVFAVRHPLESYLSYKTWRSWYSVRPHHRVTNVYKFMAHWDHLASSFVDLCAELGAVLIRYEDLVADASITKKLSDYLDLDIQRGVLQNKVGDNRRKPEQVSAHDVLACRMIAGRTCSKLGYSPGRRPVIMGSVQLARGASAG